MPLDGKSNLLLRYRGPKRTFPYVSAADVLSGNGRRRNASQDKIVLVGTTALGTREVVSTPLDTLFAGVEVQATVADNLLQHDFIRRPELRGRLETQLVVGLGLVSALVVRRFGLAWGAAVVASCLAVVWFGGGSADGDERRLPVAALSDDRDCWPRSASMTVARFTSERQRADRAGAGQDSPRSA